MDGADVPEIVHQPEPLAADILRVRAGLMRFNESCLGPVTISQHAWYLKDSAGELRGGLVGFLAWQWLTIDLLWVEESLRGRGHGRSLVLQAERMARKAGCVGVRLDTYEFQARPFYERLGYEVFGVLEGFPAGTRTYYLKKAL